MPSFKVLFISASRPSSSAGGQNISLELHDSHVRFKVKSFTVPEFFVDVPETASVGFLKKAIMEKATAMVGDGGHLGVVLQGEDIGDEYEILPKAGISHQNQLGVILNPKYIEALNGSSPHRASFGEGSVHQKSKSSMNMKRRKTEFFSTSEVEALVQTVEELGPGRWQKIKEQAFGNDSRRTYMDVKDKWRSLVKTAKRPVDERRGVFLPQGLLDRALAIETCKSK